MIVDGRELSDENKRNAVRTMIRELGRAGCPTRTPVRYCQRGLCDLCQACSRMRVPFERRWRGSIPAPTSDGGSASFRFMTRPTIERTVLKTWGRNTENTLRTLSSALPQAKITFRAAD
jgi:hypothetical protein